MAAQGYVVPPPPPLGPMAVPAAGEPNSRRSIVTSRSYCFSITSPRYTLPNCGHSITLPYTFSSPQLSLNSPQHVLKPFTSEQSTIPFDAGNFSPANQLYRSRRKSGTPNLGLPHRNTACILSRYC